MTQGMEEAEVPNAFFASVFASKTGLKDTQFLETTENTEAKSSFDGRGMDQGIFKESGYT